MRKRETIRMAVPAAVTALGCFALAVAVAPAGLAAHSVNDPSTIACPAAPAGWAREPVRKNVASPQSVPEPAAEEHMATGGNLVTVSCTYFASLVKQVTVRVSYALPTDINPVNDFYWGCGGGTQKWDTSYRVFRVPSDAQWASASFDDVAGNLSDGQVPTFERLTHQLLQNANGYGHPCGTVSKPTKLSSRYSFDIYVAGGNIKSVFWTNDAKANNGVMPIAQANQSKSVLNVKVGRKTRPLTIELTRGIDFHLTPAHRADTVRYVVRVLKTAVPNCYRGATGTLTISTRPSIALAVCSQTFLQGQVPRRIRFFW